MEFESETDLLRYQVQRLRDIQHEILVKYKEDIAGKIRVEEENRSLRKENRQLRSKLRKLGSL